MISKDPDQRFNIFACHGFAIRPKKKKVFVSDKPTLPSKTPPTLKFLLDFERKKMKMEKNQ